MNCGLLQMRIEDRKNALSFDCKILYPTNEASEDLAFGPYVMQVRQRATLAAGQFPLVIISHGNGGTALAYRNLAMHLAGKGYVVAMPEHYGNNRLDNSLADSNDNLIYRPYHAHLIIEELVQHEFFTGHLDANKIAVIGHSFGGYTALALAGGNPSTREGMALEVQHDGRIKALVLLAPAAGWFYPEGALKDVNIPVSLWAGELDHITPQQWSSEIVLRGVPDRDKVEYHVVPGAGHFSFIAPFPESMRSPSFPPSTDPEGFNREEFHTRFPGMVEEFLKRNL